MSLMASIVLKIHCSDCCSVSDQKTEKKESSPEMFKIRFYPKYNYDKPVLEKPDVLEIKREKRRSLVEDVSDPIYKSREDNLDSAGLDKGKILRKERGRESKRLVASENQSEGKSGIYQHGGNKKKIQSYPPKLNERPVSSLAPPGTSKPVHTSSKPAGTGIARYGQKIPEPSSNRRHISPPSTLTNPGGLPRTNSNTKLGLQRSSALKPPGMKPVTKPQPQMGKLALKCGSDGSVNRGGSAERRSNNQHHPCEEAVPKEELPPPLAEMDTMDALDLSSSVVPHSPDLQVRLSKHSNRYYLVPQRVVKDVPINRST